MQAMAEPSRNNRDSLPGHRTGRWQTASSGGRTLRADRSRGQRQRHSLKIKSTASSSPFSRLKIRHWPGARHRAVDHPQARRSTRRRLHARRRHHLYRFLPATDKELEIGVRKPATIRFGTGRVLYGRRTAACTISKAMLESLDYKVDIARNGEEAPHFLPQIPCRKSTYDAVLLDLTIVGGMGGEETLNAYARDRSRRARHRIEWLRQRRNGPTILKPVSAATSPNPIGSVNWARCSRA